MLKGFLKVTFIVLLVSLLGFVSFASAANSLPEEAISQIQSLQGIDVSTENCPPGFWAIIGCGTCQEFIVSDIPLCPPASQILDVLKFPVIDNVTILFDRVVVEAHVFKVIIYRDVNGTTRTRVFCVPVNCCISIPGANPFHDRVANQEIAVEFERDDLRSGGRILTEKMCVRITISLERFLTGGDPCPLVP